MGSIKASTRLTSVEGGAGSYDDEFLVDTGATDTLAPDDALDRIGVRHRRTRRYELADGTVKEYAFGVALIEVMGEITAGRVIFGGPGTEPLLGVTALESVGMVVDPVDRTFKRLPAIPLK